jgi:putative aldouronate transport system permease protein
MGLDPWKRYLMPDVTKLMRNKRNDPSKRGFFRKLRDQWEFQTMVWPGIIWMAIFAYLPMYGIIIAFKQYSPIKGFAASPWVGLAHFVELFTDENLLNVIRNTVGMNLLGLILGFPAPILFAILLNELTFPKFKKFTQTVSYMPYFISWAIFGGLVIKMLDTQTGIVNAILVGLGIIKEGILFMGDPNLIWLIIVVSGILKGLGFGAILYLAAIAGISQDLYDAAQIDGAGRFRKAIHITLPSMMGTIVIMMIFSISGMLNSGFEQIYILQNNLNLSMSETLDTYVFKLAMRSGLYSFSTAVNLVKSLIAVILLLGANFASKRLTERSLF